MPKRCDGEVRVIDMPTKRLIRVPTQEEIARLKKEYLGKRIRLIDMPYDPNPIPYNSMGTVQDVDGLGQLVMKWDNGSSLSLILEVDSFEVR